MTKGFAYLALFLALIEVFLWKNLNVLKAYDGKDIQALFFKPPHYVQQPTPDLCFLGTSRVDQGCVSKSFQDMTLAGIPIKKVYNFSSGTAHVGTWVVIHNFMLRTKKVPKVVAYEVSPCDFNLHRAYPGNELLDPRDVLEFTKASGSPELIWSWFTYQADDHIGKVWKLYRYRAALEDIAKDWLGKRIRGIYHLDAFDETENSKVAKWMAWKHEIEKRGDDGYRMSISTPSVSWLEMISRSDYNATSPRCNNFQLGGVAPRMFESSVDTLMKNGSQVILFYMPLPELNEKTNHTAKVWEPWRAYIQNFADSRKIPFIMTGREECGLKDPDFMDIEHLTHEGALKFSNCLKKKMERLSS